MNTPSPVDIVPNNQRYGRSQQGMVHVRKCTQLLKTSGKAKLKVGFYKLYYVLCENGS